jgi:hypothetical protein
MIMNAATLDVSAPSEGMLQLILAQAVSPAANAIEVIEDLTTITTGEAAQKGLMARFIARLDPGSV